jgi:outer membrane lipoprotein-sorting protein
MKSFSILLFTFCLLLSSNIRTNLYSQTSKEDLHRQIKEKYSSMESLSLKFTLDGGNYGELKAKKGNKYQIVMNDRIITCNGSKVWNYSIADKTVIISRFDAKMKDVSLEDIFFDLIKNSKAISLNSTSSSKGESQYELEIQAEKNKNIQKLILVVDKNTSEIKAIKINMNNVSQKWFINAISTSSKLPDTIFNFTAPKDAEVVDMY